MSNVEVMKKALEVMHYLEALNSDTQQQKVQTITELKEAISEAEKRESEAWIEPTPDFYITELSRNTIRFHTSVHGKQEFSKNPRVDCLVPVWFTNPLPEPTKQEWVGLIEEEVDLIDFGMCGEREFAFSFAKEVEAKLKEKNTKPLNWREEKNSLTQKVSNETCTSVDSREEFGFAPMSLKGSNYKVRGV
jgi:hypothetical protein